MRKILLLAGLAALALLLAGLPRTSIPRFATGAFAAMATSVEAAQVEGSAAVLDVAGADDPSAFQGREPGPTPLPRHVAADFRPAADPVQSVRMPRPVDEPPRRV
ncbi:hypothetical protein [uncultured Methylobacterium sp.]|uniref:hypothetical protein n=1 Tax=uncultured Methylobacterium sp. TaxID=157278 RepID=UPI0035C9FFD7